MSAAVPGNLHNAITDVYLGRCARLASFAASGSALAGVQAQPCDVSTIALALGGGVGAAGGGTGSPTAAVVAAVVAVVVAVAGAVADALNLGGGGGCG